MTRVQLNFDKKRMAGCYGFQMQDGTRYTTSRSGLVDIEDRRHLKAIAANSGIDVSVNMPTGFAHLVDEGTWCDQCKFHGWAWQRRCPRCGSQMSSYHQEEQ